MDENPEEMEAWMKMWQANLEWTEELREDFARRRRKETWSFAASMLARLACLVALVFAMSRMPGVIGGFKGMFALGAWASGLYLVVTNYVRRHTEAPLSPQGYLEKCRHNLALRQREVDWGQKMWPLLIAFLMVCLGAIFWKSGLWRFLAITFGLAAPGYTLVWYLTFVWGPKRVREEAHRLREVERSMRDDSPFG